MTGTRSDRISNCKSSSAGKVVIESLFLVFLFSGAGLFDDDDISRQNGIHVTPTPVLDGLVEPSISSSFGKDEWKKWLQDKKILD
jgi:hypothetical protein